VRVVGIDLGERRVGVAVSDSAGVLATPRRTILRSGDTASDRARLVDEIIEAEGEHVVVGLPLSLDGARGPAARAAADEARLLSRLLEPRGIAVETFDERFTTVSAERRLAEAGRRGKERKGVVDQEAATVMLQAWLDARSSAAEPPAGAAPAPAGKRARSARHADDG
jgi:putative holliday junction resolvase